MILPSSYPNSTRVMEDWKQSWLDNYPCDMPTSVPYPRMPITVLLERAAQQFPDKAGCTIYGVPTSFATLSETSRRLASSLKKLGAGPGKFVGLLLPNIPEYLVALQAVWLTGATVLQLSPLMVAEEVGHWLENTGCEIVVTLDLLAPAVSGSLKGGTLQHLVLTSLARRMAMWRGMLYRVERLRRNGFVFRPSDAHRHPFESLLQADPIEGSARINPHDDVAVLAPTGGTTDSPKAVMLTHSNLLANAMQLRNWIGGPDGQGSILGVLPFFHSYGLSVSLLVSWARASTLHLHPRFESRAVRDLLLRQKPEMVPAVPAMLNALNNVMNDKPYDLSFIRTVICGASALDARVRANFESHGVHDLVEGYGLTEASPVTHTNIPGPANRPGSIGRPLPDTEARLIDPDTGQELGAGQVGELVVHGPQIMKGYYHNPEASAKVLRDGWLYTGDMAQRSPDGFYTIVDRKRDIIKTSSFLVYPAEVEEFLRNCPGVAEVAVIGVPDPDKGEVVKALIVPKAGESIDLHALEASCKQHLSKHKRPRQIELVTELPKNFLGKVLRRKLREASNGN